MKPILKPIFILLSLLVLAAGALVYFYSVSGPTLSARKVHSQNNMRCIFQEAQKVAKENDGVWPVDLDAVWNASKVVKADQEHVMRNPVTNKSPGYGYANPESEKRIANSNPNLPIPVVYQIGEAGPDFSLAYLTSDGAIVEAKTSQ